MNDAGNRVHRGAVKADAWIAPLLAALIAVFVFRNAAALYFAQDDFAALGRAAGLIPRFVTPWRWLTLQGYFDLMRPLAGLEAAPYHLVNLAAHALAAALLWRRLVRFTGAPAALAGAAFFAAHPASFTAVFWVSTLGDLLALVFALLALEALDRADRRRLFAPGLFALSLLCKESLLLLPVVALAWRLLPGPAAARAGTRRAPLSDPALIGTALVAAAYLAWFVIANGLHAAPAPGAEPYAIAPGAHVAANALTYLGWTANPWLPTVRGFSDAVDPPVFAWGAGLALLWAALAFVPALRARGWLHAGVLYAAFVAPVLPLERHTYHYYLYGALAGAALGVAAAVDAALAWLGAAPPPRAPRAAAVRRAAPWIFAGTLAALFAANGRAMAVKIETAPFQHPELRSEPIVDRARIAANVRAGLAAAPPPAGATLRFWSPEARARFAAPGDARETYWERNVRAALYDGLAVRLFVPEIGPVEFVTAFTPGPDVWYALYEITGRTRVVSARNLAAELAANAR